MSAKAKEIAKRIHKAMPVTPESVIRLALAKLYREDARMALEIARLYERWAREPEVKP